MTDLEAQLRHALHPETGPPHAQWESVLAGADRVQRRDARVQRFATLGFVVVLASMLATVGRTRTKTTDHASGGEEPISADVVSTGHLSVGLAILAVLVIAFLIAAFRGPPIARPGLFTVLLVPIVAYPIVSHMAFDFGSDSRIPMLTKLVAVVCLPVLLYHLALRIQERPKRAATAMGVWLPLGTAIVLVARAFISSVIRRMNELDNFRMWPVEFGHNMSTSAIDWTPAVDAPAHWTPERILQVELLTIVILTLVAGATLWLLRSSPGVATATLMLTMWLTLLVYNAAAPLAFVMDFDFFLGDIVLGAAFVELSFFFAPGDIVGSFAIGTAGLSVGALLWIWGGPMESSQIPKSTSGWSLRTPTQTELDR